MNTLLRKTSDVVTESSPKVQSSEALGVFRRGKTLFLANDGYTDIHNYNLEEVSLRVIKEGKLGSTFSNLNNPARDICSKAILSSQYASQAEFDFTPKAQNEDARLQSRANIFSEECANLSAHWLAEEGKRIFTYLKERAPDMQFNVQLDVEERRVAYYNSHGREDSYKRTRLTTYVQHIFEGSKEGVEKMSVSCAPFTMENEILDSLLHERQAMLSPAKVLTGPKQVLFLPGSAWTLVLRLTQGVAGNNIASKVSPLQEKIDSEIFCSDVTIREAPDRDGEPGSVPFDDEGVITQPRCIVENGVLKGFIHNRKTAAKTKNESTGNGIKRIMWGDGIQHAPAPYFSNLVMDGGSASINEIISKMNDGIVVCDVVGFHSGNTLAGHFSMGIGSGFLVKNGEPVGRLTDTMVSGNIYEDFKRILSLSSDTAPTLVGRVPAILVDGIQVSTKS